MSEIINSDNTDNCNALSVCLEFLANDISSKNNFQIHTILKRSIETNTLHSLERDNIQRLDKELLRRYAD